MKTTKTTKATKATKATAGPKMWGVFADHLPGAVELFDMEWEANALALQLNLIVERCGDATRYWVHYLA